MGSNPTVSVLPVPIAQLDRASDCGSEGRRFESSWVRISKKQELFISSIAIIPARSGSQGIVHKNITPFAGIPLIAHTIQCALQSKLFSDVVVSTDSEEYANIARAYGANVPFLRPASLAESTVPTSEVTLHTLQMLKEQGKTYDTIAVLLPTSPLRTIEDLKQSLQMLQDKDAEIIISVCVAMPSPLWCNSLQDDLSMKNFIAKEMRNKPRQQLEPYYCIHGAIFWARYDAYRQSQDSYAMRSYAYIMPSERSIDIDNKKDLYLAEQLFQEQFQKELSE